MNECVLALTMPNRRHDGDYSDKQMDEKDRELLLILSNHPDWTYEQIAQHMKMTNRAVGYRIERLHNLKILQKAQLIYYDRMGELIYAAVLKIRQGISSKEHEDLIWEFKENPATIQVFSAMGAFSMIVLIHAESPKEADRVLKELCLSKQCIESCEISQITDIYSIYRSYA